MLCDDLRLERGIAREDLDGQLDDRDVPHVGDRGGASTKLEYGLSNRDGKGPIGDGIDHILKVLCNVRIARICVSATRWES